jgi:hypothetical protein
LPISEFLFFSIFLLGSASAFASAPFTGADSAAAGFAAFSARLIALTSGFLAAAFFCCWHHFPLLLKFTVKIIPNEKFPFGTFANKSRDL